MHKLATLLSLTLAPPVVAKPATPEVNLTPINVTEIPERCHEIAKRASGPHLAQALSARISLGNCVADANIATLTLIDGQESIGDIDAAIAPSLALLDEVIVASPEPSVKVMANHAKAQLYAGMMSRMLNTVPPATDGSPDAQALRESRRAIVETRLEPWRANALEAHRAVIQLSKLYPQLAKNPVAHAAIIDSQRHVVQADGVATR